MEKIAVILTVIGFIIIILKNIKSKSDLSLYEKQWDILDLTFEELIKIEDYKSLHFNKIADDLYEKYNIHKITTIRFYGYTLIQVKNILIKQIAEGNKNIKYFDVINYFEHFNKQIITSYKVKHPEILHLNEDKNIFFYTHGIWLYKNKKNVSRGFLILTLKNLIFIPRKIDSVDFKKLLPIVSVFAGLPEKTTILSNGLKIFSTIDDAINSTKPKIFTKNLKENLLNRYDEDKGFTIPITDITQIKTADFSVVITINNDEYRFDDYSSPFSDSKEFVKNLKYQFELLLNINSKTLIPKSFKTPVSWDVVTLDLEKLKTISSKTN